MAATKDDGLLMVELAKWATAMGLAEAQRAILSDTFNPNAAHALDKNIQTVLYFYETVGTLAKNDMIDRGLVYDWLWVKGAWERVGPAALREREKRGVPALFENFEALAEGQGQGQG